MHPPKIRENLLYSLFQTQVTNRLLHLLKTSETPAQKPLVFLDIGYGEKNFITRLVQDIPLSSYILCHYPEDFINTPQKRQKSALPALHQVILDKNHFPFSAVFDVILVNWTTFSPPQPDFLLRQLIGCLKPGGASILSALANVVFMNGFMRVRKQRSPFLFLLLNQRQPIWPEDHRGELQEEWYEIPSLHLPTLLEFFENLPKTLFDYTPLLFLSLQKAFDLFCLETNGHLTFHTFYGRYTKPEELLEE